MKKKIDIRTVLSAVVCVLMLLAEGLAIVQIIKLDILTPIYLTCALVGLLIVTVPVILGLFPRKKNRNKVWRIVLQVIAALLALVLLLGSCFGYAALARLDKTFDTITKTPVVSAQIGVYVLNDDPAQSIEDAKDYLFGVTSAYDADNTNKALTELNTLYGAAPSTRNYDNVPAMITGLYFGDVRAIVLNTAYLPLLEEAEDYVDFSSKARLLHTITLVEEVPVTEPDPTQTTAPGEDSTVPTIPVAVDPLYRPFVIYLSGSDTRDSFLSVGRNDVNILAVVNPTSKQILLINTPRDYFIPNSDSSIGSFDKLAHCGVFGLECSKQSLADFYEVPITYHAQINFTGFETLIDAIGGVTIYSEEGDGVMLQPGANYMNGEQALAFARNRMSYADGDNARGRHQMQVISAMVDQLTSGTTIIRNYSQILESLEGMFVTSVPSETITAYIKMQLADMAHWDVFSYAVTGYGGYDQPYSMGGLYAWVMYPYLDTVDHAKDLMNRVLRGEVLTPADIPFE